MRRIALSLILFATAGWSQQPAPAPPAPGSAADLVQQGVRFTRDGQLDQALALYRQALDKSPDLYEAHLETGIVLDLKGDYAGAREHLNRAIEVAPAPSKRQAWRAMAMSYAFEGNADKSKEFEAAVLNLELTGHEWVEAADTCNELARIYLESGDLDHAFEWYQTGYDTAMRKTDLSDADKNLWRFRWESAQARILARRGQAADAEQHVAAAKAALDQAHNPDQTRFYPYLKGYVAFYSGDYKTAIAELQKADQHDPLNLVLLGESYEKSGDLIEAKPYYQKVLEINIHNPTNAFARPLAKKKLGA
jgi:tetratricopeptide (TPR) repeat protein